MRACALHLLCSSFRLRLLSPVPGKDGDVFHLHTAIAWVAASLLQTTTPLVQIFRLYSRDTLHCTATLYCDVTSRLQTDPNADMDRVGIVAIEKVGSPRHETDLLGW